MNVSYNEEFVDKTRPFIKNACMALVILSVLLDIAIYKWRHLVHYCIALDLVHNALYMMIPNSATSYT